MLGWLLLVSLLAACSGDSNEGDDGEFFSAAPGDSWDDRQYEAPSAANSDGDALEDGDTGSDAEREIVESDLYKVSGNSIFVLNSYRGLAVIDFSNPQDMQIQGRLRMQGTPKEMFVDNGVATILLTGVMQEEDDQVRNGSQVVTVDVSDPTNPLLIERFDMAGTIVDSRQVGDVIYVVSSVQPWWDWCTEPSEQSYTVQVMSVNVANPNNVFQADLLEFEGGGWAVYVTQNAMYVASTGYENDWSEGGYASDITVVDISDPAGTITKRGSFNAAARVLDRFKLHQVGDVLVVTSITNEWNGDTRLETFDVSDPDNVSRLGMVTVMENEQLHATRYDGNRAYIVTYENTDPLFVVDFSTPSNPIVLGELEIPGWSTHMEIRGTKIYSVGVDDQDGRRVKVALFDVQNPLDPKQLATVSLGESYAWSEALYDWKAFKVYDDLGLILVPTSGWDERSYGQTNLLTLIDFSETSLTKRGSVASDTPVRRGFVAGDYLASLSETDVQLIDFSDRDNPEIVSDVQVAGYVTDLNLCGDVLCNLGAGYYSSPSRLRLYDPSNPGDTPYFKSRMLEQMEGYGGSWNTILANGDRVFVLSESYGYWGPMADGGGEWNDDQQNRIHEFDLSDSANPEYLGSAVLEGSGDDSYYYYSGSTPVILENNVVATFEVQENGRKLNFYNVNDIDNVTKSDSVDGLSPLTDYGVAPIVRGTSLWAPTCEDVSVNDDGLPMTKCYASRFDATTPDDVKLDNKINIPGQLIALSADTNRMASIDRQFTTASEQEYTACRYSLELLSRNGDHASRIVSIPLYTDQYCYYHDSYYSDGDVEPPSVDGQEPNPTTADSGDGTSVDPDDEEIVAEETRERKVTRTMDEEVELSFSGLHAENDHVFVIESRYGYYNYSYGYDVAVSDAAYPGGCTYGEYDSTSDRIGIKIYNMEDGELEDSMEFAGVNTFQVVQGGGLLLMGNTYGSYTDKMRLVYIDGDGVSTELQAPEFYSNSYYNAMKAVRVGDMLYVPFGWEGIEAYEL